MAYSQQIIQVAEDKVAAIATSSVLTSVPHFYTKEMWDFNQLTDAEYPLIILDRPIQEKTKIGVSVKKQKSYTLIFYLFAGCVEVNADHATIKEPLLIMAQEMKDKLIKGLDGAAGETWNIEYITSYRSTEIPETKKNDNNPVGLLLELDIVFEDRRPCF